MTTKPVTKPVTEPVTEPMTKPTQPVPHISVCICTFKRAHLLGRLLQEISLQETNAAFTFSIVVVDNDAQESAREVVERFAAGAPIPVRYAVEPQQNIALARNQAVANATGDFIAFIDDDEESSPQWLSLLLETIERYQADGVLGPVNPRFVTPPPDWIVRGKLFDRPSPPTGTWLRWDQTRSGNTLLRRKIFDDAENWFREEYGRGGEDVDFFRRMIAKGMRFVWCAEAVVHELVPEERTRRKYLLRRALSRGRAPYNQGLRFVLKSLVALPVYALILPVLFLFGQHWFMRYLVKSCDHLGRILAFLGVDAAEESYVSQ